MIYFITGGQRSGKSSYGQKLALQLSQNPIYIATSRKCDANHIKRIERHKNDRDQRWTTIEEDKQIGGHNFKNKTVLLDCITLWLTNYFVDTNNNIDQSLNLAKIELNKLFNQNTNLIIISNELGMGLHAETEIGRNFTNLQGWVNQFIA